MGNGGIGIALKPDAASAAQDTQSSSDAEQQRVRLMAQQFEALLVTQMLREMRQAMLADDGDENGLGKDTMTDTLDIELGTVLSRAGGFGLGDALSKAMALRAGGRIADTPALSMSNGLAPLKQPASPPAPLVVESSNGPGTGPADAATVQVPRGRVSSAYGWRSDPFNGVQRFHNGIDVALAYGGDVRAAASGRVAFAGDRGSYGTTIVVEHGGGRQTLYAHLSTSQVQPGDVVEAGQVIGKSGNSGHSTGPHLHFEVRDAGQPVDPDQDVVMSRLEGQHSWTVGD